MQIELLEPPLHQRTFSKAYWSFRDFPLISVGFGQGLESGTNGAICE